MEIFVTTNKQWLKKMLQGKRDLEAGPGDAVL